MMTLTKPKKIFYTMILSCFLVAGLYINFELDRDFLTQFGFSGLFVVVSILFFIGLKIIAEFLFFKLQGVAKYLVGIFALFVIIGSITSIFFIRIYKSESMFQHQQAVNTSIENQKNEMSQNKSLLLSQINSVDEQIKLKMSLIGSLDGENNKWLKHRYNNEINALNAQKTALLDKFSNLKGTSSPIVQKEKVATLHDSLNRVFGVGGDKLTLGVNLIFTIFVDTALLLLIYGIAFVSNAKETRLISPVNRGVLPAKREIETINHVDKPVVNDDDDHDGLIEKLANSSLTREELSNRLGISTVALWKITTGKTKSIRPSLREKIEAL